jgi:hypothetical protein
MGTASDSISWLSRWDGARGRRPRGWRLLRFRGSFYKRHIPATDLPSGLKIADPIATFWVKSASNLAGSPSMLKTFAVVAALNYTAAAANAPIREVTSQAIETTGTLVPGFYKGYIYWAGRDNPLTIYSPDGLPGPPPRSRCLPAQAPEGMVLGEREVSGPVAAGLNVLTNAPEASCRSMPPPVSAVHAMASVPSVSTAIASAVPLGVTA